MLRGAGVLGAFVVWALTAAPTLPAPPPGGAAPLAVGWGRVKATGTVTGVSESSHTVTLAIAGSARWDEFEGGSAWRQRVLTGTRAVRLLPATLLADAAHRPITAADMRAGDLATVWGVVQPDETILALALHVSSPRFPQAAWRGPTGLSGGPVGVVLDRSGSVLDMLTAAGTRRSVVMTAATSIRSGGQPAPAPGPAPYDILRIEGPVNSDGSIAATRIDVEFAASSAAQVSGPVEWSEAEIGGLVVGGTMIVTSTETYIVEHATLARFADLAPSRPITVYGAAVRAGDMPIGLHARVVLAR
jgi:Domain of unknown function (DUF5666)